jgi:hypothetical protein
VKSTEKAKSPEKVKSRLKKLKSPPTPEVEPNVESDEVSEKDSKAKEKNLTGMAHSPKDITIDEEHVWSHDHSS